MMPERLVESTDVVWTITAQAAELGLWKGLLMVVDEIDYSADNIGLDMF